MSPLDYPFGDVRPWLADRRLGEGVAMVSRPLHVLLCVQAQVRRRAPDGPYEGPNHLGLPSLWQAEGPVVAPPCLAALPGDGIHTNAGPRRYSPIAAIERD